MEQILNINTGNWIVKHSKRGDIQKMRDYISNTSGGFKGCKKEYGLDWRTLKSLKDHLEKVGYDWQGFDIKSLCDTSLSKSENLANLKKQLFELYGVSETVFEDEDEYVKKYELMEKIDEGEKNIMGKQNKKHKNKKEAVDINSQEKKEQTPKTIETNPSLKCPRCGGVLNLFKTKADRGFGIKCSGCDIIFYER